MNTQGQTIVTVMFVVGVGILVWVLFAAPVLATFGHQWASGTTGIEALLADNLNLFVGFGILCFAAIGVYVMRQ